MTQDDKELLLKDLCARIPYRTFVCLNPGAYNKPETCLLTGVDDEQIYLNVDSDPFRIDHIKPYLRSMSSMNEEEKIEWVNIKKEVYKYLWIDKLLDFYLSHHLDFRGLILMGLALEAPEGMYKTE